MFIKQNDIYKMNDTVTEVQFDYDIEPIYFNEDMSNKLFCTFATEDTLESTYRRYKKGTKLYTIKFLSFTPRVRMSTSVLIM